MESRCVRGQRLDVIVRREDNRDALGHCVTYKATHELATSGIETGVGFIE